MGDCISRQAVLDEINKVCFSRRRKWIEFRANNGSNGERDYLIKFIKKYVTRTASAEGRQVDFSRGKTARQNNTELYMLGVWEKTNRLRN